MRRIFIIIICVVCSSCNNIEFVYKNEKNLLNPLYEKTNATNTGFDLPFMKSYIPMFFGVNDWFGPPIGSIFFHLFLSLIQDKIKRDKSFSEIGLHFVSSPSPK